MARSGCSWLSHQQRLVPDLLGACHGLPQRRRHGLRLPRDRRGGVVAGGRRFHAEGRGFRAIRSEAFELRLRLHPLGGKTD